MAYITGAELTTYATARGISLVGDPSVLVVLAHDYVDNSNFVGTKTDPLQANEWPRTNAYFKGVLIGDAVIPNYGGGGSVINMEFETAITIDQGNDPLAVVDNSIKKTIDKIGPITEEVEYIDQGKEAVVSQRVSRAAAGLISAANNGIRFTVFN
jgi:hypothetical protein